MRVERPFVARLRRRAANSLQIAAEFNHGLPTPHLRENFAPHVATNGARTTIAEPNNKGPTTSQSSALCYASSANRLKQAVRHGSDAHHD